MIRHDHLHDPVVQRSSEAVGDGGLCSSSSSSEMAISMPISAPPWPQNEPLDPWWLPPPILSTSSSTSRPSTLTPATVAVIATLGTVFLLVSCHRIFTCRCRSWPQLRGLLWRRRVSNSGQDQAGVDVDEAWVAPTKGLDESVIRSMPVLRFKAGQGMIESLECVVCLAEFQENETLRVLPKCSHAFHVSCVDKWLQTHSSCPLCHSDMFEEKPATPASILAMDGLRLGLELVDSEALLAEELTAGAEDPAEVPGSTPVRGMLEAGKRSRERIQEWMVKEDVTPEKNAPPPVLTRSNSTGSKLGPHNSDDILLQRNLSPHTAASSHFRRSFSASVSPLNASYTASSSSYAEASSEPSQDLDTFQLNSFATPSSSSSSSIKEIQTTKAFWARTYSGRRVFSFWNNTNYSSTSNSLVTNL